MPEDNTIVRTEVRERVWEKLREVAEPDSRFAWDFGEFIADYDGSDQGAERLLDLADQQSWDSWLVTPDNNLDSLREHLIERETPYLMPTYGIRRGVLGLDPADVPPGEAAFASVLDGMNRFAERRPLEDLEAKHPSLDVMVTGASFVTRDGLRMGKGHGFFDLEWAMLRKIGLATEDTRVVAAVHDVQILEEKHSNDYVADHDTIVDYIVTPTAVHRVEGAPPKPEGIYWDLLSEGKIRGIPPLETLWERAGRP